MAKSEKASVVALAILLTVAAFILVPRANERTIANPLPQKVAATPALTSASKRKEVGRVPTAVAKVESSSVDLPSHNSDLNDSPRDAWRGLDHEVAELDSEDQDGLDRLYEKAANSIQADPLGAKRWILDSLSAIGATNEKDMRSDEEIFFAVSAWIRYSDEPTRPTEWLAAHKPPPSPLDSGHVTNTPATRHDRVWAYSLRELRRQVNESAIPWRVIETPEFVNHLATLAKTEASLNVSIEIFHLLRAMKQNSAIQSALVSRSSGDREILQTTIE